MAKNDPAKKFLSVTPSDTESFEAPCRALFVGGIGTVAAVDAYGNEVSFTIAAVPSYIYAEVAQVKDTGTDATNIVALF